MPRLISQLYEESIFISIGNREFKIPKDIFSDPGNSPNYFSLGFAVFFSSPTEVFPGLNRDGLLRPPSILPPSVPNRSADTFQEILHLLSGYPLQIKNEDHRAELLRDCRYFHLKGLEQKLIRHTISYNLARGKEEITLRIEDIRQSGISVSAPAPPSTSTTPTEPQHTYVNYARPFIDTKPRDLVLEIGSSLSSLHFPPSSNNPPSSSPTTTTQAKVTFHLDAKTRISRLFEVLATKLNLPTTQPLGLLMKTGGASSQPASPGNTALNDGNGDLVGVVLDFGEADVWLDGKALNANFMVHEEDEGPRKKRKLDVDGSGSGGGGVEGTIWIIKTAQWRLRIQHSSKGSQNGKVRVECVLVAVKIDAVSGEKGWNSTRGFLDG